MRKQKKAKENIISKKTSQANKDELAKSEKGML